MTALAPLSRGRPTARLALPALAAGATAIAFAPIFVRLSELGPTATAFWRLSLAVPALWLWMSLESRGSARPRQPAGTTDYLRLAGAGLFFAGDLATWHWSIRLTTVANSTLLANFAPIFVSLAAWLWFRQTFTRTFVAGLALAMAGVLVLMGESAQVSPEHVWGDLLGIGTAVFYAGYILSVGRLRAEFSTATIMTWSGVITAAALLPVAWLSGEALLPTTVYGWAVLIGLALISHCGGQSLIAWALAHLPPTFASIGLLLQPAEAMVFAWILLGEPLGAWQGLGALVILVGIALARRGSQLPAPPHTDPPA